MYNKQKNGWNRDWETDNIPDDMTGDRLCDKCGQPIKPGRHKPEEYRHAQGCPKDRSKFADTRGKELKQ